MGFRVWGLEFRVCGLGFVDWGLGFRVWGLGFRVSRVQGFSGLGISVCVEGCICGVEGSYAFSLGCLNHRSKVAGERRRTAPS